MQLLNAIRRGIPSYFHARKSIQILVPFLLALFAVGNQAQAQLTISSPYRTVSSGSWDDIAIWQVYDGNDWVPATEFPNGTNSGPVKIQSGHNIFIGSTVSIDELTIDESASVAPSEASLQVLDGPGDDVICNGTITLGTAGLAMDANATVIIGST